MVGAQYGAYLFPVVFVVFFQSAVLGISLPPLRKSTLVTLLSAVLAFALSDGLQRVAWMLKVL